MEMAHCVAPCSCTKSAYAAERTVSKASEENGHMANNMLPISSETWGTLPRGKEFKIYFVARARLSTKIVSARSEDSLKYWN